MDLAAVVGLVVEDMRQHLDHGRAFVLAGHIAIDQLVGDIGIGIAVDDGDDPLVLADARRLELVKIGIEFLV